MIDISIITVTSKLSFLQELIYSMKKFEKNINYEHIVIDNATNDETFNWLKNFAPDVRIIKNRKIQGFAFNNNIGIKRSKGKYILLLNPDIIFIEEILPSMIKFMDENKDVGISSCKLLYYNKDFQYSARRFYTFSSLFVRRFPIYKNFMNTSSINKKHLYYYQDKDKIFYPDWILGAFMLIKREIITKIGFLDERFRMYFEDVDYCGRCWNAGYKVAYYPYKSIIHLYNRESDTKKLFKGFRLQRGAKIHLQSMIKYLKKYKKRFFSSI